MLGDKDEGDQPTDGAGDDAVEMAVERRSDSQHGSGHVTGVYDRSQSQVEMEYIGSHGNLETVSVDENWVGERSGQSGQYGTPRNPHKRPRTDSQNGDRAPPRAPVVFYGE